MSIDTDRKAIEESIKDAKKDVELAKALERLQANRDFKLVIGDGYFKEEAVRVVHRLSLPEMQNPASQAMLLEALRAISNLSAHFSSIMTTGETAKRGIASNEAELEVIANEEQAE